MASSSVGCPVLLEQSGSATKPFLESFQTTCGGYAHRFRGDSACPVCEHAFDQLQTTESLKFSCFLNAAQYSASLYVSSPKRFEETARSSMQSFLSSPGKLWKRPGSIAARDLSEVL
jgi:hypothetical protein